MILTAATDENIVGYDARETWMSFDFTWPERRKIGYLYRRDLVKPLSVDATVWQSIFASENLPTPRHLGFQTSWANLPELQQALTLIASKQDIKPFRLIAIGIEFESHSEAALVPWAQRVPRVDPARRSPEWKLLGYDIADQWMLSALSNCGFTSDEDVNGLRREWGPKLNQFHLFSDLNAAFGFKRMSNKRLENDHAPCFVYGLWALR
jgi:hypothetical protein